MRWHAEDGPEVARQLAADWFDFLGLRVVWVRFFPQIDPLEGRPLRTGVLWLVGLYTAVFGLASGRYEAAQGRAEFRMNAVLTLYQADRDTALSQVAAAQAILVPVKPDYKAPVSVLRSWLSPPRRDAENVEALKLLVHSGLRGGSTSSSDVIDLSGVDLSGVKAMIPFSLPANIRFDGANLSNLRLRNNTFENTSFDGATLEGADLSGAHISECSFRGANLADVVLEEVRYDPCTVWPEGFDPRAHGAQLVGVDFNLEAQHRCADGRRYSGGKLVEE